MIEIAAQELGAFDRCRLIRMNDSLRPMLAADVIEVLLHAHQRHGRRQKLTPTRTFVARSQRESPAGFLADKSGSLRLADQRMMFRRNEGKLQLVICAQLFAERVTGLPKDRGAINKSFRPRWGREETCREEPMHKFFGVAVGALVMIGLGATAQAAPVPNSQGVVISSSDLVLAAQKERQGRQGERQDTRSGRQGEREQRRDDRR
jgi:hypothetical protein